LYKYRAATALYLAKFCPPSIQNYAEICTTINILSQADRWADRAEISDTERSMLMEAEVLLYDKVMKDPNMSTEVEGYRREVHEKKEKWNEVMVVRFQKWIERVKKDDYKPQICGYLAARNNRFFLSPIIEYFRICVDEYLASKEQDTTQASSQKVLSLLIEVYGIISSWARLIGNKDILQNSSFSYRFLNIVSNFLSKFRPFLTTGPYQDIIVEVEKIVDSFLQVIRSNLELGIKTTQNRFGNEVAFLEIQLDDTSEVWGHKITLIDQPYQGKKKQKSRPYEYAGKKYKLSYITKRGAMDTEYFEKLTNFLDNCVMIHAAEFFVNASWKEKIEKYRGEVQKSVDEIQAGVQESLKVLSTIQSSFTPETPSHRLIGVVIQRLGVVTMQATSISSRTQGLLDPETKQ
jgi:hypothetical protein